MDNPDNRLWHTEIDYLLSLLHEQKASKISRIVTKTRLQDDTLGEEYKKLGIINECIRKLKIL